MSGLLERLSKQVAYLDSLGLGGTTTTPSADADDLVVVAEAAWGIDCDSCGRNEWWKRWDNRWICGVCHPEPPQAAA